VKSLSQLSPLTIALSVSVLFHGALLAVRFAAPDAFVLKPVDAGLEVILVNAKHKKPPLKADALAQANLDGGGQADTGRSRSPLPDLKKMEEGESIKAMQRYAEELEVRQNDLVTRNRKSNFNAAPVTEQTRTEPTRTGQDLIDSSKAIARTAAEIDQRIEDQNKRPRKTFISPSTREVGYAIYYKEMSKRIEEIGTLNFPQKDGRKLYGELTLEIPIFQDGDVYMTDGGIKIVKSSGKPDLDKAAIAIVRRSAPFGRFPSKMRTAGKDEVWVVITSFKFTRSDQLETELRGN
jgi:periplasmic protein TonB